LNRFDKIEKIRVVHEYQHDLANGECMGIARHERAKIAIVNFAGYRVPARTDLHRFASP
jgi:hypothetical protein